MLIQVGCYTFICWGNALRSPALLIGINEMDKHWSTINLKTGTIFGMRNPYWNVLHSIIWPQ